MGLHNNSLLQARVPHLPSSATEYETITNNGDDLTSGSEAAASYEFIQLNKNHTDFISACTSLLAIYVMD